MEEHRGEALGGSLSEGLVDELEGAGADLTVSTEGCAVVGSRGVDAHQVQPVARLHPDSAATTDELGDIIATAIVIARDDGEATASLEGATQLEEELVVTQSASVGDVTGHHEVVDVGLAQRIEEMGSPTVSALAVAEVEVGEVREDGHAGSLRVPGGNWREPPRRPGKHSVSRP
jgi:hypothetical protein